MAIVASLPKQQGGDMTYYRIPDDVLQQYRVDVKPATSSEGKQLLGTDSPGVDQAHAVVATGAEASEVQAQRTCIATCLYDPGPQYPYYIEYCCRYLD